MIHDYVEPLAGSSPEAAKRWLAWGAVACVVSAWWLFLRAGKAHGALIVPVALPFGLFGARLWGELVYTPEPRLFEIIRAAAASKFEGQSSIIGGVIGAALALTLFAPLFRLSRMLALAVVLTSLVLAQVLGRIGCFLNGCCFGDATELPWGVRFPLNCPAGLSLGPFPLHPVQLYDAVCSGALFVWLVLRFDVAEPRRAIGRCLAGYGACRFLLEYVRADRLVALAGLSAAQIMSIVLVVLGGALASGRRLSWRRRDGAAPK